MRRLAVLFLAISGLAQVKAPPDVAKTAPLIVVRIAAKLGDRDIIGSGLIVGRTRDRLYIATANHVVRDKTDSATNIRVYLRWRPGESSDAILLENFEPDMDLAVLAIPNPPAYSIPFDRVAPAGSAKVSDNVYLVGYPGGTLDVSPTPERITSIIGQKIKFRSSSIAPGHSGGGLFNEKFELIGMIRSEQSAGTGEAIRIDLVLDALRDPSWNYPVALREASATPPAQSAGPEPSTTEGSARRGLKPVPTLRLGQEEAAAIWKKFYEDYRSTPIKKVQPSIHVKLLLGSAILTVSAATQLGELPQQLRENGVGFGGIACGSEADAEIVTKAFASFGSRARILGGYRAALDDRTSAVLLLNFDMEQNKPALDQALSAVVKASVHVYIYPNPGTIVPDAAITRFGAPGKLIYPGKPGGDNVGWFFRTVREREPAPALEKK